MLNLSSVEEIATSRPDLFAFRINREVTRADMTAFAEHMNEIFDRHDKVDLLLIFDPYEGAEIGAGLSWEAIRSQLRALTKVRRYVVVGAPDTAEAMIEALGRLMPVQAETYDEEEFAWSSLDASAVPSG